MKAEDRVILSCDPPRWAGALGSGMAAFGHCRLVGLGPTPVVLAQDQSPRVVRAGAGGGQPARGSQSARRRRANALGGVGDVR